MARTTVRRRLLPAQRRECELASNTAATIRSAAISPLPLAQVRQPQSPAIGAPAQRRTQATTTRQQYQCDRFPRPQWPTTGSKRMPGPGALLVGCNARDRATRERLRNRKRQMLLSTQMWIREWRLQRGRIAAPPLDMGSVDP